MKNYFRTWFVSQRSFILLLFLSVFSLLLVSFGVVVDFAAKCQHKHTHTLTCGWKRTIFCCLLTFVFFGMCFIKFSNSLSIFFYACVVFCKTFKNMLCSQTIVMLDVWSDVAYCLHFYKRSVLLLHFNKNKIWGRNFVWNKSKIH